MKNPETYDLLVQEKNFIEAAQKLIFDLKGEISRQIAFSMKKIKPLVYEQKLYGGMLHLFFSPQVAKTYDQCAYYDQYITHVPDILAEWFCHAIINDDTSLKGTLFINAKKSYQQLLSHYKRVSSRGVIAKQATYTAFFSALRAPILKGKCRADTAYYFTLPNITREIHVSSIQTLLTWAIKSSGVRMHVSLNDAHDLESLMQLQEKRQQLHQLHVLDAIALGYEDMLSNKENDLNAFSTNLNKHIYMDYEDVRFCSYESFMYLVEEHNMENIALIAGKILKQLDRDYLYHGLTLSQKELAFFLSTYLRKASQTLLVYDEGFVDVLESEVGQTLLAHYITNDQCQEIVFHHKLSTEEVKKRKKWVTTLTKNPLPPRLYKVSIQHLMNFNEMYILSRDHHERIFQSLAESYEHHGYTFDGYFICFTQLLLDAGCNVKYVIQAYKRFTYHTNYLRRYPYAQKQTYYTLDLNFIHDFYLLLHPMLIELFFTLHQYASPQNSKKISNIILKSLLSYNLDNTSKLADLTASITSLLMFIKRGVLFQDDVLNTLNTNSSLISILSLCKERELQVDETLLKTIKETLDVQTYHLQLASSMLIKESYIELCYRLTNSKNYPLFHTPNPMQAVHSKTKYFNVSILPHNDPLSLFGPALRSVCIAFDSHYHHQQLNPSFMNLCIYSDKELILWGLLCRASDIKDTKTVYILNNFQGSINDHKVNPASVKEEVIKTLKVFLTKNSINAIFLKDQYFNAINLCEGLRVINTVHNQYSIERNARLDFETNDQGVVQQDKFYVIDADAL